MDRHSNDPKHLRTRQHKLYIRVAADEGGPDTAVAYANPEDRAKDVNRLQERTADSAIVDEQDEQDVFDEEALNDLWEWAKAEGYTHYDAVDDFNQISSGKVGDAIKWEKS